MELDNVLEQKANIFDHILYEFEMYIATYMELFQSVKQLNTIEINVLLESHAIHLRNLIEFFNNEKDCITTNTIFKNEHDFRFDDSNLKAKQAINKSIGHLTKERYKWNRTVNDLTLKLDQIIKKMFRCYIVNRVRKCVDMLINTEDIREIFLESLNDIEIKNRLNKLSNYIAYICENTNEVIL